MWLRHGRNLMKTRRWITLCAVALLGLSGRTALAQLIRPRTMIVVIKFTGDRDPWAFAPQMASATGMELVGISPSTRSAVFAVPNEINLSNGTVAARNQATVTNGFPGMVYSYNYGVNYPMPADLQQVHPYAQDDQRRDRGGYDRDRRFRGRFNDRDRDAANDWYNQIRNLGSRLEEGTVLDRDLRSQSYPAPPDLVRRLNPPPPGARYLIIGRTLVMVDDRDYV